MFLFILRFFGPQIESQQSIQHISREFALLPFTVRSKLDSGQLFSFDSSRMKMIKRKNCTQVHHSHMFVVGLFICCQNRFTGGSWQMALSSVASFFAASTEVFFKRSKSLLLFIELFSKTCIRIATLSCAILWNCFNQFLNGNSKRNWNVYSPIRESGCEGYLLAEVLSIIVTIFPS